MTRHSPFSRRDLLKLTAMSTVGSTLPNWLPAEASESSRLSHQHRSVIVLWMTGGASQIDTFDMKPGHENGGPFRPIDTTVPGIQICEHLPQLAQLMHHCIPIRSMKTPETDHVKATYHLRTGHQLGDSVGQSSLELPIAKTPRESALPAHIALAPYSRFNLKTESNDFHRSQKSSVIVGEANQAGVNPDNGLSTIQTNNPAARLELLSALNLDGEKSQLRDAYGRNQFGQACLTARRLVERGASIVEVSMNNAGNQNAFAWDTHSDNFTSVRNLLRVLDPAWSSLIRDLETRGLLESTLIVWMSEFGRSPKINAQAGRDHFADAWTTVLCGGGIRGGQSIGKTSSDGMTIVDQPYSAQDLLAEIRSSKPTLA